MILYRPQRGFSLLEVLITLVLTAIGLLGIAALVLGNLKAGSDAQWRARAAQLSAETVARMRANYGWRFESGKLALQADPYRNVECRAKAVGDAVPNTLDGWQTWALDTMCAKVGDVAQGGLPGGTLRVQKVAIDAARRGISQLDTFRVEVSWCAQLAVADDNVAADQCEAQRTRRYVTHVSF